jgi:hypothetical protein
MRAAVLLVAGLVASAFARLGGVPDVTMHDNYVYFNSDEPVSVAFSMDYYALTNGQPWGGVSTSGNSILVRAGRHDSPEVAALFENGTSFLNMLATEHVLDTEPEDLNFAIFGSISFTIGNRSANCTDFRVAQGHELFTNNWWLASPACLATPLSDNMVCTCNGFQQVQFHTQGKSDQMLVYIDS